MGSVMGRCLRVGLAVVCVIALAEARELTSKITYLDKMIRVHPEYPIPAEPNQIFHIERSSNSNTVIYCANLDAEGKLDKDEPVIAYWRWYNDGGHKKKLNFAERMMAYGIKSVRRTGPDGMVSFHIAALPERTIYVGLNAQGKPEALGKVGGRWARLEYVYLEVDDSGILPKIPSLDFFGYDRETGKPLREHVIPH